MEARNKEDPGFWFRSERYFCSNGEWFFYTREGLAVGPYLNRTTAEAQSRELLGRLNNVPADGASGVIRTFLLDTGGKLDYVNDPAFSGYLVSEEEPVVEWTASSAG